jgi:hypothetical protein
MILFSMGAAWTGHTPESQADAEDIAASLMECGISKKTAAYMLELTNEQQFSRQLAGTEPLNHYRLNKLPAKFHIAYLRRQAARRGAILVTEEQSSMLRAFAELGIDGISKLLPGFFQERRSA